MGKKENLQLAHTYKEQNVQNWWWSEKLDGMRFFWDGGITNGMLKSDVPWANCEKDERYKVAPVATGLWSRYMNVIQAPDEWLADLPKTPLDGELWMGYEYRQDLMSIVKKLTPSAHDWAKISGHVFDMPDFTTMFPNDGDWIKAHSAGIMRPAKMRYRLIYKFLQKMNLGQRLQVVEQLPFRVEDLHTLLATVNEKDGEGLMLRNPDSFYLCERAKTLLKVKPFEDDEGTVTGYVAGKGKYLGMVGAVILDYNGVRLEMSGFTDVERYIHNDDVSMQANFGEGEELVDYNHEQFPLGSEITFKYRGKSKDGVPQEARYWRQR